MKPSVTLAALLAVFALPAAAARFGAPLGPLALGEAHAQDPTTEAARKYHEQGVHAFDAGKFEEARSYFLQAYQMKRAPALLLNIGLSELKAGHVEDGGNHLQQFLREHAGASSEQKATAEQGIAEAKRRGAYLVVAVDAAGADVSVDGSPVGKSPLLDPVFVKPGRRTLFATLGGQSATVQVDAKPGRPTNASLAVGAAAALGVSSPSPAVPAEPAPPPASPVAGAPIPFVPPEQPAYFAEKPSAYVPPTDSTDAPREPFLHWYRRKPVAWVGSGATVVGLIGGAVFTGFAAVASDSADEHSATIRAEAKKDGIAKPCGSLDGGTGDVAKYKEYCDALRDDISDHSTDQSLAVASWVLAAVGATATVTYVMVDWYPNRGNSTVGASAPSVAVAPVVGPTAQGVTVLGRF